MVTSGSDPLRAGGQRSEVGRLRDGNQRGSTEGFHGGSQQALPSGEQVTTQNGLTDKDLLELEALKLQGLRDLETQPLRDMLKRKEGASGGSGSFQSVVGDGVAVAQSHLLTPLEYHRHRPQACKWASKGLCGREGLQDRVVLVDFLLMILLVKEVLLQRLFQ